MASRIRVIVKGQSSVEPLDVVVSGRAPGRLASLRLPAGDYEIYQWKMVVPSQYGGDEYSSKRAFSYPFRITPGRATYLGSLNLRLTDEDTYGIAVEDCAERDLALLAKKVPSVKSGSVIDGVGKIQP